MNKNRYLWLLGLAVLMLCSQVYGGTWTPNQFFYKPSLGARGMTEKNNFNIGMEGVDTHLGKYKTLGDPGHSTLAEALATIDDKVKAPLRGPSEYLRWNSPVSEPIFFILPIPPPVKG